MSVTVNGFYESGREYCSSLCVHHINKINQWCLEVLRYNKLNYVSCKLWNIGVEHESLWENSTLITANLLSPYERAVPACAAVIPPGTDKD